MRRVISLWLPTLPTDRLQAVPGDPVAPPPPAEPAAMEVVAPVPLPTTAQHRAHTARGAPRGWSAAAVRSPDPKSCASPSVRSDIDARGAGGLGREVRPPARLHPKSLVAIPPAVTPLAVVPPVVTAIDEGGRRLVAGADDAARALGIVGGTPLTQARAMVPGLVVHMADPHAEMLLLGRIAGWAARRVCPLVAIDGTDGLLLDIAGCAHLHGGEERLAARLLRRMAHAGLAARLGLADTPGAAHAVARFGGRRATLVPPGQTAQALAGLPIRALRIEPVVAAALDRVGIDTVTLLAGLPRGPVARRFPGALRALDRALGRVAEPIDPLLPVSIPRVGRNLVEPIGTAESFGQVTVDLSVALCAELERRGLGARALDLLFHRVDGRVEAIRVGTALPVRDAGHIARLMCSRFETVDPGLGVEAMTLLAARTEPFHPSQVGALDEGDTRPRDLSELVDRLAGKLGADRLHRAAPLESDLPERAVARLPALAPPGGGSWPPALPRPVRLLSPPEPVDVTTLLPDYPPRAFSWRGHRYLVACADGPERIHGEWWRQGADPFATRDYYRVETEAGGRFWLFRRGDGVHAQTGDLAWFLHGAFA